MNFVTIEFVCFFLPALLVLRLSRARPAWHLPALVLCNFCFYAATGLAGLAVLLATAFTTWLAGHCLGRALGQGQVDVQVQGRKPGRARLPLLAGITACLCLLFFFKYNDIFLAMAYQLMGSFAVAGWLRPLLEQQFAYIAGISFFVFQAISYLVDIYRNDLKPAGFARVFAWLAFFPLVMSGPITRAGYFFEQLGQEQSAEADKADAEGVEEGFLLILSGLFKKVVLSSYLAEHLVRQVFAAPESCSALAVLVGIYGYSMQIYCDFSGYTDLAIGIARLLGYRLPENFRAPYLACNLQDFWRSWHITLSTWFRDYLYIPLGGSRKGNVYCNLLLTMGLCGLWHGSGPGYLVWGLMHGLGLGLHRGFAKWCPDLPAGSGKAFPSWFGRFVAWFLTFNFVSLLWVFFKADNLDNAMTIFARLLAFGQGGTGIALFALPMIGLCLASQYFGPYCLVMGRSRLARLSWPVQGLVLAVLVSMIFCLGPDGVLPFIYFGF